MENQKQTGIKAQTFLVTVDEMGRKIYTSQTDPSKSYLIDAVGNMLEYSNNIEISSKLLKPEVVEDNQRMDITSLEEPSSLGIINSLEGDFDINLMNELDSGIMNIVNDTSCLMQHMNIQEPLSKLKLLLEDRVGIELQSFTFYLQGAQMLEDHMNLVEQCVQGEGLVQINVQIQKSLKRINIIDVLKPAEDYINSEDSERSRGTEDEDSPKSKKVVQWQVDTNFKKIQEKMNIPLDPREWNLKQVNFWLNWAIKQFNLKDIDLWKWKITGKELFDLSLLDFQKVVTSDPNDIFWTHLELLRKMKVVAVMSEKKEQIKRRPKLMEQSKTTRGKPQYSSTTYKYFDNSLVTRNGYNGQIQLWQFLLELLTSSDHKNIISWLGKDGEFKLTNPESVAKLWGKRKNKPKMNYEKLSRALRYYYDGDMISKVHGKRFVYKFVCDLKQLLGYSAVELSNLVNFGNPRLDL